MKILIIVLALAVVGCATPKPPTYPIVDSRLLQPCPLPPLVEPGTPLTQVIQDLYITLDECTQLQKATAAQLKKLGTK
jgi:hypothetical protein